MDKFAKCPCDSKLLYHKCCKKYHDGSLPPNAEALMRSRYSAYAAHLPEYIMSTTHADHPEFQANRSKWKDDLDLFMDGTQFNHLKISEFTDGENTATVTFTAYLVQADLDATFTEKSTFEKVDNKWLYKFGVLQN